jgi:hypothetical protein
MSLGVGIELLKAAGLEPLVVDDQAVMVPEEDRDPIASAVEKQKEMAGQGGPGKAFSNQADEAIDALTQVGGPGAEKDAHRGGELGKHQMAPWQEPPSEPAAWIAARSNRGLSVPRCRTTQVLASSISRWVPASRATIDTGTKGAALGVGGRAENATATGSEEM